MWCAAAASAAAAVLSFVLFLFQSADSFTLRGVQREKELALLRRRSRVQASQTVYCIVVDFSLRATTTRV